jgi:tRNA dimethylallyltransferase
LRQILIIGGPTGSGKNRAALEVARRLDGEIVNADSRQIYRGLAIGTNQPAEKDISLVPHHLYGFLDPGSEFSVAGYERLAVPLLHEIGSRGRVPILTGGTGFYIRAVLKGVWPVPKHDPGLRARLRKLLSVRGREHFHRLLNHVDPASASKIPVNDSYRVMRTLEIFFQTGRKRSEIHHGAHDRFPALKYFLDIDPQRLRSNIESRTRLMFDSGWIDEVRGLCNSFPDFQKLPAARSLGYSEILRFLQNQISLDECLQLVTRKTMQYAKRQKTWFRNQDGFSAVSSAEELHKKLESVLQ